MRVQRCKGTRDLSPEEMTRFRLIEGVFRDCCLKWGYREVRTPTLEYLHLFTSTGTLTPGRLDKVYSFLDWDGWSGERVVLRPDGTIPVARLYIDSMEGEGLAKLFYVANVFIFEATGKKTRERWQCGAELIGAGSPLTDVELVMLALEILKRLKLEGIELRLSHAGLIRASLAKLGLSPEEQTTIFDRILDGDTEALAKVKFRRPKLKETLPSLLDLKGKSPGFLRNLKAQLSQDLPELQPHIDDFINLTELLEALGCDYQIDIASGRGFEYYTGVIFQLFRGEEKIGGGGRYDALIPLMGGKDIPASGFALYLDRLMSLVKPEALAKPLAQRILVRAQPAAVKEGFSTADYLREAGYVAEFYLGTQEQADFEWTLAVKSKQPLFILTDQVKRRRFEAQTIKEVLAVLREKGGDKGSVA
ncbi:MAG: ATP phosphoribosyltransferase regulatory subunit [Dehalococcoidia bacterium]|nr:ATP phosphoribosyltransferase regulatory subunit [Dehalococcoidia bacterium]